MKTDDVRVMQILKILELNNYNYSLTAKQTGASRNTIKKWAADNKAEKQKKDEALVPIMEEDPEITKKKFEANALRIKEAMLDKIEVLLPKCKDVESIARSMKILHEMTEPKVDATPTSQTNILNYINLVQNKIIEKKYGTAGN